MKEYIDVDLHVAQLHTSVPGQANDWHEKVLAPKLLRSLVGQSWRSQGRGPTRSFEDFHHVGTVPTQGERDIVRSSIESEVNAAPGKSTKASTNSGAVLEENLVLQDTTDWESLEPQTV